MFYYYYYYPSLMCSPYNCQGYLSTMNLQIIVLGSAGLSHCIIFLLKDFEVAVQPMKNKI